jgi:hypothetical protein
MNIKPMNTKYIKGGNKHVPTASITYSLHNHLRFKVKMLIFRLLYSDNNSKPVLKCFKTGLELYFEMVFFNSCTSKMNLLSSLLIEYSL